MEILQKKKQNIFIEQINSEREMDEKIIDFYSNKLPYC